MDIVVVETKWELKGRDQALGHVGGVVEAFDVLAQHDELVPTEPGHRVGLADGALDPSGGLHQELISDAVAKGVVDRLEPVQVDVEDAAHAMVPTHARQSLVESVRQHDPVGQTGEGVMEGLEGELGFEAFVLGKIPNDAGDDHRAVFGRDRAERKAHGEVHPIAADALDFHAVSLRVGRARLARCEIVGNVLIECRRHDPSHRLSHDRLCGPAEHLFGGRIERQDRAIGADGENSLCRVVHDRSMMRLPTQRLIARRSKELVRTLFGLADRSRHDDHDRECDGAQESQRLRIRTAQERRHPSLEDQHLTQPATHERPSQNGPPRRGAGLLNVDQRGVDEAQSERRSPAREVDHGEDRQCVEADAHVQSHRSTGSVGPPFEPSTD